MGIRLFIFTLMFLVVAASCREPAATSAFTNLEHDFEQAATDVQQQVKEEVEYNFITSPKFGHENMRADLERARAVQNRADTISAYISHLKDTLSWSLKDGDRQSSASVKSLLTKTGIATRLHSKLITSISQMIEATLDKRDEEDVKKEIVSKCRYTFNDSGDWDHAHFRGGYHMAQMELSRIKADLRTAEKIILSYHIRNSNRGCALPFDQDFAVAVPKTTYAFPGEAVDVAVFFATMPDTSLYKIKEIEMEGQKLNIVNGVGSYRAIASGHGIKSVYGSVTVQRSDGEIRKRPVRADYFVDHPFSVIQTSQSKILYAGIPNHFTVSVPFALSHGLTATVARGAITGNSDGYNLTVNDPGPLTIYVHHKNEAGKLVLIDSSVFTVKSPPAE